MTLKANELRIGNYLNSKQGHVIITQIKENNIVKIHDNTSIFHVGTYLKPIELLEKRLYELGLQKYEDSDIPTYFKNFGNHDGEDFEYCFMIFQDVEGSFYTMIMGKKIILESVHQTQNLFFAITGEELSLKNNSNN